MDWRELCDKFDNGNARLARRAAPPHTQSRRTGIVLALLALQVSVPTLRVAPPAGSDGLDLLPRPSKRREAETYHYSARHVIDHFGVRRGTRERRRAVSKTRFFAFRVAAEPASLQSCACDASVTACDHMRRTRASRQTGVQAHCYGQIQHRQIPYERVRSGRYRSNIWRQPKGGAAESETDSSSACRARGPASAVYSLVESGKQNVTLVTAKALANVVNRDVRSLLAPLRSPTVKR